MTGRGTSTSRSQTDASAQLNGSIPAMFRTQQMASQALSQALDHGTWGPAATETPGTSTADMQASTPLPMPSLADLQMVALDIKNTLSAQQQSLT